MASAPHSNGNAATRSTEARALSSRNRIRWITGVLALSVSIGLGIAYFLLKSLTADWGVPEQIAFRTGVVFIGFIGLMQIAVAMSATRGVMATPRFGSHRMLIPSEGFAYLGIMCVLFTGAMLTKQNSKKDTL